MEKFVLVTRGRTGSTAIIDELNKCRDLIATQELFLPIDRTGNYYKLVPPFDYWRKQASWWKRMMPGYLNEPRQAHTYLRIAEDMSRSQGAKGFGFKVLSNHFDERLYLGRLLKKHGYRAVYLTRNIAQQVVSGMVANQSGIYNSFERVVGNSRYKINIDDFKARIQFERNAVKNDCAMLREMGFDFIRVSYEDFCVSRETFYGSIFNFLNLPLEMPPSSDFVKVVEDLKMVIENYDEVENAAFALGVEL